MFLRQKLIQLFAGALIIVIAGATSLQAEDASSASTGMTPAMQKAMDPNVWTNMMAMMMNPEKAMSMESCAECHDGEDVARYQKDFGPMMEAMKPMMSMMNPHMMTSMMNPMMGMMNPMMGMMNPMMGMMNPMMGMMNPMMGGMMNPMMGGMMNPMMGGMMNPMMGGMMNPMTMMNMMYPMMGMMGPMMGMGGMGNPMMGGNPMGQMMDPKQYENWFNEMMKGFTPQAQK